VQRHRAARQRAAIVNAAAVLEQRWTFAVVLVLNDRGDGQEQLTITASINLADSGENLNMTAMLIQRRSRTQARVYGPPPSASAFSPFIPWKAVNLK
jgi:hypothetical protein